MPASDDEILFPRPPGFDAFLGSMNYDTRFAGRANPAFGQTILSTTDQLHYFVDAIETTAPTNFNPRQYAGVNKSILRLDNGTVTSDKTFNDVLQGMVVGDAGGASAGTRRLFAGFGQSTNPRNAYRDLSTDTTPWTVNTDSTAAQWFLIAKAGPDLYAVTDAGVAVLGEYRISKCPAGSDPSLAASWGNGFEVGTPEWAIVGLAAIGDSICVGKPDGLYYFDDQVKRFVNVLKFLEADPNAVNGKGMRAVPNGVLYPTHDGQLWFFDGVQVQNVTPERKSVLPRDVSTQRITAIASSPDGTYLVRETFQNTTQGMGLKFITRIADTYADVTSSVTDGNLSTGADIGSFGNDTDDALFVGSTVPLEGVCFRITRNVNAASVHFAIPQYSNGTAGGTAPFDSSFTSFSGRIWDASILSTASMSCVDTGFPPAASNAVISWSDINSFDLSTSTTISFGGSIGDLTRYWYRIKATASGTGMTTSTTIDEVEIIPSRAGIPITAANDFSHRYRAGCVTEVMFGKQIATNDFAWTPLYALHMGPGVWAMAYHSGRIGVTQNMGQALILWGRFTIAAITEGPTRDPARTIAPVLAGYGTTVPGPLLNLAPGGTYLTAGNDANRYAVKEIDSFTLMGDFIQQDDIWRIYVQMDETDCQLAVEARGAPWKAEVHQSFRGQKMQAWLEFRDAVTGDVHSPDLTMVSVQFHNVATAVDYVPLAANTAVPELT